MGGKKNTVLCTPVYFTSIESTARARLSILFLLYLCTFPIRYQ